MKIIFINIEKKQKKCLSFLLGTRIPTARQAQLTQNNLMNSSANVFNSKHCVSREQLSTTDLDSTYLCMKQVFIFLTYYYY